MINLWDYRAQLYALLAASLLTAAFGIGYICGGARRDLINFWGAWAQLPTEMRLNACMMPDKHGSWTQVWQANPDGTCNPMGGS